MVEPNPPCNNCEVIERTSSYTRRAQRGITLVELMVVVVIAGVLATVGITAMYRQVSAGKSVEAMNMIQSIRAAQEQYRAVTGIYLDVSSEGGFFPRNPTGSSGQHKVAFFPTAEGSAPADIERWMQLAPTVSGPVQYGYMTRAGLPGTEFPELQGAIEGLEFPTPTESWYLIEALGDVDGDSKPSYFFATSLNGQVFSKDATE